MSTARQSFLERIGAFRTALGEENLVSGEPAEIQRNNTARLLRNGLAVVGFAILEDFLRSRLAEILARVGNSHIPFDELPEPLRDAAVLGAARALAHFGELKRRQGEDYVSFVQNHSQLIASTVSSSYEISGMALGWTGANLSDGDIKEIMRAFRIKDGWGNIDIVAKRVGLASPSHREAFSQAAVRRHKAAHSARTDTEVSHLVSFVPQAIGIALGFDALMSRSLKRLLEHDSAYLADSGQVQASDVQTRFIDPTACNWREIKEGAKRAVSRGEVKEDLIKKCLARPDARDDVVIVRDSSLRPSNWMIQNVA